MCSQHIYIYIYIYILLLTVGCTKNSFFTQEEYIFPGVQTITSHDDGTYTLYWEQVPSSEVSYLIYSRLGPGTYNFNTPTDKTSLAKWTTPNLRFVGNTCFIVRFIKSDLKVEDANTNEKCTGTDIYSFAGLKSATIKPNGSLVFNWDKIPQDGVTYEIFSTSNAGTYNFSKTDKSTSENTIAIDAYPSSQKICYVVRYLISSAPKDTNKNEICPDLPYLGGFFGVDAAVSSATGLATVSWLAPTAGASDVVSYKIYSGVGFSDLKGTAKGTETSLTISGLVVDETVALGVRAVDKYGREDANTKTVSVKVVNNATPTFNGLSSAVQVNGQQAVALTWVAADGKIKAYKIYSSTGAAGTTPAINYTSAITSVDGAILTTTISGLGDDLTYCFDARAVTSGGQESTTANVKCVTLPDSSSPNFTGIKTAQFAAGGAQITWDASVSQVTSYYVYYQLGSNINFATAAYQIVTNPAPPAAQVASAAITGLQDMQTYSFAVRAIDKHSQIDTNTASQTKTAGDLTPPVFLGVVSLIATDDTHLQIVLNRSTDSDMSYYSLRIRETAVGGAYSEVSTTPQPSGAPATVTAVIGNLMPSTSYDVIIKAIDTAGNASTNNVASTRSTLDLTPPTFGGITTVASDPADGSKVKISWNAATDASGIVGYRVYHSTNALSGCAASIRATDTFPHTYSGCNTSVIRSALIAAGTNYLSIGGLTEGQTYSFLARAIDNSSANNEDTNTVQSAFNVPYYTPPAAPGALAITGGNGPSASNTLTLTGTGVLGNTVKVYANGTFSTSAILSSTSFSILVTLPTTPATYSITASQVNISDLEGSQSTPLNYILQNAAPTATMSTTPCTPTACATSVNSLGITIGGTNVTTYQFAVLFNQATTCAAASYNGSWVAIATQITTSLVGTGDGSYRVCAIGKDAVGNSQLASTAAEFNFTRSTIPPAAPTITSFKDPITNSTTDTYNGAATVVLGSVAGATKYCAKGNTTAPATPTSSDACWTSSTTVSAILTGTAGTTTTNSVYAWAMDAALNISSVTTSAGTISYVNICSTGTLADTCTISTSRTLAGGNVAIGGQGSLVIASGGTISGAAGDRPTLTLTGSLTIQSGGTISANLEVTATNVSINNGGIFKADNLGYTAGLGPGAGSPSYNGGGHGGAGGGYSGTTGGGVTYGSLTAPTTLGSGAGNSVTGIGGGAIKIVTSGFVLVAGTLSANGSQNGLFSSSGSGGSIYIISGGALSGTGTIQAKGGVRTGCSLTACAGGGGGRISITGANPYIGTISVAGSSGASSAAVLGGYGENGTLYTNYTTICDSGTLATTCTVTSAIVLGEGYAISGAGSLVVSGSISTYKNMGLMSIAMTGDVTIQNGGSINANLTNLSAANVNINSGGVISADNLGFWSVGIGSTNGGSAAGGGTTTSNVGSTGGGGHGGFGGNASAGTGHGGTFMGGTTVYGVDAAPVTFGSAGGSILNNFAGWGGGRIKITIASGGTLTVNGTLSAKGQAGVSSGGSGVSTGGGAGGSLYLIASTIAGSGIISADGGAGGTGVGVASGGGGGGRISLSSTNKFSGSISVSGGASGGSGATAGYPGYAYFTNSDNYCGTGALSSGTCTISSGWRFLNGGTLSGVNLTVANGGSVVTHPAEQMTISMSGDVTVNSGGTISANITNMTVVNVTVLSGGSITANALGYQGAYGAINGAGPVAGNGGLSGTTGSVTGGGGGGHGGAGGNGYAGAGSFGLGGTANDSSTNPTLMGSAGGGTNSSSTGGDGGGYIKVTASGTVTIDGTVSANGTNGTAAATYGGGGGAGGGIKITAPTISGSTGTISVNGGAGGGPGTSYVGGGGGGGGIIYMSATSFTFTGTKTATGGALGSSMAGNVAGSAGFVTP